MFKDRTIADQAITMTKLLHLGESASDRLQIRDLLFNFNEFGIDTVDDIRATFIFVALQLQELFDFGKRKAQRPSATDEADAHRSGGRILTMAAL